MSNCSNCYNGCAEIVSDRCVKYTGIDFPELGIQTGDTLSSVENSIINFLIPVLSGVGVKPIIDDNIICTTVRQYLPTCTSCTGFTLNDILSALIKAVCDLQEQIDEIVTELGILNADYTIGCLTSVTASSDTHAIVQSIINTLCTLKSDFEDLLVDLPNTYVSFDNVNDAIQAYLDINGGLNIIANRMVPYAVVPYFGPIAGIFDSTGAGQNNIPSGGQDWSKIYLCNGNLAPDLRGYGLVGAINGVPGGPLNAAVDPSIPGSGNPNYSLYNTAGANQITLGPTQIPLHTHNNTATSIVDEHGGHTHNIKYGLGGDGTLYPEDTYSSNTLGGTGGLTTSTLTGITVATTITNAAGPSGGGLPHSNIQPVTACYYIQYRP